ncbi:MAG: hypothetical protein V4487_01745 [Chlamydiota bacterium]
MKQIYCAESRSFFEISGDPRFLQFNSFQSRLLCLKDFFKKIILLPLALLYKAYKTIFRVVGLSFGAALLGVTLGSSTSAREFFVERVSALAKDLADWILLPFAVFACFFRLILAFLVHPNIYFNY